MSIKNEYAILYLMLRQIVETDDMRDRRRLYRRFIKRLAQLMRKIDLIEEKIDAIADKAIAVTEKERKSLTVDDMYKIDSMMSAYHDLKFLTEKEDD